MNISLNWLQQYVSLPKKVTAKDFGLSLTLSTVEVEGWDIQSETLENIVVGKIVAINPHPNADKLRLVEVSLGSSTVRVVCGGTNLKGSMLIALAKVGSRVRWHGQGELITLEPATIRGEKSDGMICASSEIGLGEQFPAADGEILDLTSLNVKPGTPVAEALGLDDVIYEVDNKSMTNRPDVWGHYGMAREVATKYKVDLKPYEVKPIKPGKDVKLKVAVESKDDCPRYCAVAMSNVEVGPSPAWLVQRLQAVGLRSINNIVDITNYVMYDLGQPMHAFDYAEIAGSEINVRRAVKGERLRLLDETEKLLTEDDVVIADVVKPLALAGVMGGEHSGITDKTTTIVFESANFDPATVRKTAQRHNVRTDSSQRFEKSLDPTMAMTALEKAVMLVKECCPTATVSSSVVDVYKKKLKPITIKTSYEFLRNRVGHELTDSFMHDVFTRLGFGVKGKKGLTISVPSWRSTKDISIAEDLVEEVARMFGYDNLTPAMPDSDVELPEVNRERKLERLIKNVISTQSGAIELHNYSFVTPDALIAWGFKGGITLQNPSTEGHAVMRPSLLPGLMHAFQKNERQVDIVNLFEIGRVFLTTPGTHIVRPESHAVLPAQPLHAAGVYAVAGETAPFSVVKGMMVALLEALGMPYREVALTTVPSYIHPHRVLTLEVFGKALITVGEIHPAIATQYEAASPVGFWMIDVETLATLYEKPYTYQPIPKFPRTTLDISLVAAETTTWQQIKDTVAAQSPLIRSVDLFDVFKNDKIGAGKRSLAFHIVYGADDRTLTMEEVQKIQMQVVGSLEKECGAEVRK